MYFEEQTTIHLLVLQISQFSNLVPAPSPWRSKKLQLLCENPYPVPVNNISNVLRRGRDRVPTPTTPVIVFACVPLWNITLFLPVAEDGSAARVTFPEAGVVALDRSDSGEFGEDFCGGSVDDFAGGGVKGNVQCTWRRLTTTDWLPPPIAPPFPVSAVALDKLDVDAGAVGGVCVVDGDALSGRIDGRGSRHLHTQAEDHESS